MALYKIKTDMQLRDVYDIQTNFHSRTQLPVYSHVIGGQTPATMRLQGGKGDVQYPPEWITYCEKILNNGDVPKGKYLFHINSGIQNSSIKGRMIEGTCEGNIVDVIAVTGNTAFLRTYHTNDMPPSVKDISDPRIQKFTVVTRDDELVGSPKGDVYFPLMARPGENLWISMDYLMPINAPAPQIKPIMEIVIYDDFSISTKSLIQS